MSVSTSATDRPLRADAVRNRARILGAAGELFAQRGLSVTLNDIAHHAGVGVGTVYRHFPDKDELIETLFQARVDEMVALLQSGLAHPDPWRGFVEALEGTLELQAANRGLSELVYESPLAGQRLVRIRERLMPLGGELISRAQAAGAVRPDVRAGDLPMLRIMIGAVIDGGRGVAPGLWRRYLTLVLRGIATDAVTLPELSEPAPSSETVDQVMSLRPQRRR